MTATARPKDDDDPARRRTWRAAYAIGADGAHSTVRGLVGADFAGETILSSVVLADEVLAHAHRAPGVSIFAGARIDLTHLRSEYRFVAVTPQTNVDKALAEYADIQGADIRRGFEVVALDQDPTG